MKLFSFSRLGKMNGKTIAVCDIGSGSIAVGIVAVDQSSMMMVLVSERRSLPPEERAKTQIIDQLKTLAQETATAVLDQHAKRGGAAPSEVVAIVHTPWTRSETASESQLFDEPTVITEVIISETAKRAVREETKLDTANIFERTVMRVALNGYPTSKPEGKTSSRVDISVLQSDIKAEMLSAMQEALGSVFVGRTITFQSAFFAFSVIIKELLPNITHYTLIDVTSLATSAAVVRQAAVLEHANADIGWRTIISELAKIHGTTPTEALSRARMAIENTCTDALCQSVLQSLSAVEPMFVDAYGKMFNELAKVKRIPGMVILVAPPDLGPWFANIFSRVDFAQFAVSEQPFSVHQLWAQALTEHVDFAQGLVEDTGVAATAAFVHIRAGDRT